MLEEKMEKTNFQEKQNIITEERNQLFCQYSPLFDFFNITIVTLKFDFSEDISYEYIYPSNLHEVFPKLETFLIEHIDKEINEEKNEIKPDLFVILSSYSRDYDAQQMEFEKKNLLLYNNKYISYMKFIFIQDGENPRVKIQFDIPPLLITIRDGLVDTIIIFNIFNFIQPGSYPEYIQLFKDIITTHVFPNATTLKITYYSYDLYIPLLQDILQLITKNHFPKLHIYDISDIIRNEIHIYKENYKFVLFSESIIQLMDTIIYDKDIFSDILENVVVYPEISEAILNTNNTNYFTIQVYEMKYTRFDISQINLKKCIVKSLILNANSSQYKILNKLRNCMKDINYNELQTLFINLNPDEDEEYEYDSNYDDYSDDEDENIYVNQYIYEYFSFLSVGNYKNVTTLSIDDITFYSIHGYIKNKIKVETLQILYHFFSLFSNNLTRIKLTYCFFVSYIFNDCLSLPLLEYQLC
ncbi:hypothetical protein WA158_005686 [Blastocystis sp. Blastoise]